MRRWSAAVVAVLVGVVACLVAAAPTAQAAKLVASNPAPHEELSQAPGWVTVAFDDRVRQNMVKVLVVDGSGANVVTGDLVYMGSSVMVQLEDNLPKGTYTVKYRVNRADGQPEGGAFQFAYGKGHWTDVQDTWSGTAQQPPEMANPDPYATGSQTTPTATPTEPEVEVQTASPAATASVTPTPTPTPTSSAGPAPSENAGGWPWLVAGAVVLVGLVVAGWLILRGRRRS